MLDSKWPNLVVYLRCSQFLNKTGNATFGFFTVKIKEFKGIYLMAILNNIVAGRLRLV